MTREQVRLLAPPGHPAESVIATGGRGTVSRVVCLLTVPALHGKEAKLFTLLGRWESVVARRSIVKRRRSARLSPSSGTGGPAWLLTNPQAE